MKNVRAIIVTYYPDFKILKENINQLLSDSILSKIYVVDNTPSKLDFSFIVSKKVTITCLNGNKGIAFAQNIAIKQALNSGADYIILFDQDSKIHPNMTSKLLAAIERSKENNLRLACIGPRPIDSFSGKKIEPKVQVEQKISLNFSLCKQIISSGKLIDSKALKEIGLMDDALFIDGVDHEWCWRASKLGYQIAISENTLMEHTLGERSVKFLGINYRVYPPIRMYYQFRNSLILLRRDYVPFYGKVRSIINIIFRFIAFGFIRKKHKLYREYMYKGIIDGIRNKKGSYESR